MSKSKFTDKQIDALENLRDVVMMYKGALSAALDTQRSGLGAATGGLDAPIQAILDALAECEDDVD